MDSICCISAPTVSTSPLIILKRRNPYRTLGLYPSIPLSPKGKSTPERRDIQLRCDLIGLAL